MRVSPRCAWLLAFAAVFAALVGFVFWGTWSLDVCPVMPDSQTAYPLNYVETWTRNWLANGKFVPGDLIVFVGSPYFWTELRYALAVFFAALGMAYFLRGRGLPRVAAYGAGILLAFSGYWFTLFSAGHFGWFQWMTYGVFAFGLVDRALEKGRARHWLLLGAVLAWGSFYQPDLWLLFTVFQAAYFVFRLVVVFRATSSDGRRMAAIRWTWGSLLALAAFVAIGLPSFRSAIVNDLAGRDKQVEEGQTVSADAAHDAAGKRWIFVTNWSLPPAETREFFSSRINGDTSCPYTLSIGEKLRTGVREYTGALGRPYGAKQGNYRQHSLYVGWVTCLLAVLGIAAAFVCNRAEGSHEARGAKGSRCASRVPCSKALQDRSAILFFAVAAVVFWLFSMGRYCEPIYRLVYALPMGDYLRAPVKWHHLTEFCLCALAGYGIAALSDLAREKGVAWLRWALPCLVLLGVCDLAGSARLYCAPHRADADMQFIDARSLQDPQTMDYFGKKRIRVIGTWSSRGAALVEIPKKREVAKFDEKPAQASVLAMGIVSLAATLGALLFTVVSLILERRAVGR